MNRSGTRRVQHDDDRCVHVSCAPAGARGVGCHVPVGSPAAAGFPPANFKRPSAWNLSLHLEKLLHLA